MAGAAECASRTTMFPSRRSITSLAAKRKGFRNGAVYIEKYIEKPRHIEFQILADSHGKVLHLGERDCSVQRRHQKLIEESPSPFLTSDLRKKMGKAAIKAAEAAEYENAGTIEFLVDAKGNYYFIEMNIRHSGRASGDRRSDGNRLD